MASGSPKSLRDLSRERALERRRKFIGNQRSVSFDSSPAALDAQAPILAGGDDDDNDSSSDGESGRAAVAPGGRDVRRMTTEKDFRDTFDEVSERSFRSRAQHATQRATARLLSSGTLRDLCRASVWLPRYSLEADAKGDLVGGLAEGVMLIPQGMAYAMLASLPPIVGLYASISPALVYCGLGTSRHLSFGPFALVSLLVAESVAGAGLAGSPGEATTAAAMLCILIGIVHVLMGLVGLGVVATFLADPVLSGYTTAAAFLIGASQLKHLLGVELPRASFVNTILHVWDKGGDVNLMALALGLSGAGLLLALKEVNRKYFKRFPLPSQLVLVVAGTLLSWAADLEGAYDVAVIGEIPSGLPGPRVPRVSLDQAMSLLQSSFVVAIISYIIVISIGKTFANKFDYEVDANQELIAIGLANVVGGFFQAYPASGSLSRSAVLANTGARSPLHAVVCVAIIMVALALLTGPLYYLPRALLASIILTALKGMINFKEAAYLRTISTPDFYMWVTAFSSTILLGVQGGIAVSVGVSVLWLLRSSSRPPTAVLGRLPGTTIYRNVKRFKDARELPGIKIFRFDSSLHFANKDYFEQRLRKLERPGDASAHVDTVIIDASSVNAIDASAIRTLQRIAKNYRERSVTLLFANWKGQLRDMLASSKFHDHVPMDCLFLSLHDAVLHAQQRQTSLRRSATTARLMRDVRTLEVTPRGKVRQWSVMQSEKRGSPSGGGVGDVSGPGSGGEGDGVESRAGAEAAPTDVAVDLEVG